MEILTTWFLVLRQSCFPELTPRVPLSSYMVVNSPLGRLGKRQVKSIRRKCKGVQNGEKQV